MLFPISQLIKGRGDPLSISKSTLLREALTLMVVNDYSQLPVINEQGNLIGIISESSIISTYYHVDTSLSLLDLTVDHCMATPKTITPERDIFEALGLLENVYAVVVVEDNSPKGILTDYDTTHFFRGLSEGLIIVRDIEENLRHYIESVFPDTHSMDAALVRAFKQNKKDLSRPAREYGELSFREHIQLITTERNWEKFAPYFEPKEIFTRLMDQAGKIRNQLAHFRGELEPIQLSALVRARDWLSVRPKVAARLEVHAVQQVFLVGSPALKTADKYAPLYDWLQKSKIDGKNIKLTFEVIEKIIGDELPPSARDHRSWWANDPSTHIQALSWVTAGWVVDDVDLNAKEVTFRQTNLALYYTFFSDLLTQLKSIRPGITQTQKASLQNWLSFSAGRTGFYYTWTLPREHILRVDLYIDLGDEAANKAAFDKLLEKKDEVEKLIGVPLNWERLDQRRASRVSISYPFRITDEPEKHAEVKKWGVEMMLKFIEVFSPLVRTL